MFEAELQAQAERDLAHHPQRHRYAKAGDPDQHRAKFDSRRAAG
jgi:hypothetical protein